MKGDLAAARAELQREWELAATARAHQERASPQMPRVHAEELEHLAAVHSEAVVQGEVDLTAACRALNGEREVEGKQSREKLVAPQGVEQ